MLASKSRPQYGSIDTSNSNIYPSFYGRNFISVAMTNTVFVILFYMLASKSRPQYGSIDTSNSNIHPLVTIL